MPFGFKQIVHDSRNHVFADAEAWMFTRKTSMNKIHAFSEPDNVLTHELTLSILGLRKFRIWRLRAFMNFSIKINHFE